MTQNIEHPLKKVQCVDFGRGRLTETSTRTKLLELIGEAIASGARAFRCCEVIGLSYATYLRWWKNKDLSLNVDKRLKEHRTYVEPKNKLSEFEYNMLNHYLNCEEYKHLSPIQIVPRLMDDKGIYIASESTFYRFMRLTGQNTHR